MNCHRRHMAELLALVLCVGVAGQLDAAEPPAYGAAEFVPSPKRPINFRGDPRGGYPGAVIPTDFSAEKNLAWKADVGEGCASPLVVGQRVFVQAAPNALVCLDATTGPSSPEATPGQAKELWRRTKHAGDLDAGLTAVKLEQQMDKLHEYHLLYRQWRKAPKDETLIQAMEAKTAEFPEPFRDKKHLPLVDMVPGAGVGGYGHGGIYLIVMTPCSDDQRVVAVFPTGIAVAYDLDGKWLWSANVRTPDGRPIEPCGGLRVRGVLATDPIMTPEGIVVITYNRGIQGLEAASGKVVWEMKTFFKTNNCASPVLGVIDGESFIATGPGDIIRARDGLVVREGPGLQGGECSVCPVFADGVFYWVPQAVRVTAGATPNAEVVWTLTQAVMEDLAKGCYGWKYPKPGLSGSIDFTSPVIAGNRLIYYGWIRLTAFDLATGKVLCSIPAPKPNIRPLSGGVTKNWAYGGMTLAGDRIVLVHDNGLVKIFPVNDTFAPMEACAIPDDVYAHPVAQGRSLYIRSLNALWKFETK